MRTGLWGQMQGFRKKKLQSKREFSIFTAIAFFHIVASGDMPFYFTIRDYYENTPPNTRALLRHCIVIGLLEFKLCQ